MAYTTYPSEASEFGSAAKNLSGKLETTSSSLKEIQSIFTVDKNEDYLTIKTIDLNAKIVKIIEKGKSTLSSDSVAVKNKADELEKKARDLANENKEKNDNKDGTSETNVETTVSKPASKNNRKDLVK